MAEEQKLAPVHYPKTGGVQVNPEKRERSAAQDAALKKAHDLSKGLVCPEALRLAIAVYLTERRVELGGRKGAAVRYALEDEIADLLAD